MLTHKLNLALIAGIAIAICGIVIYSLAPVVKAQPTAINIVAKTTEAAVGTITFPQGAPGATVSNPYNDVNLVAGAQVVATVDSSPVVRLKNTSGGPLTVSIEITAWSGAVASEDYELVDEGTTNVEVVDNVLSGDGSAASVATGVSIPAGEYKALYLEVVLGAGYGKSGTSTLTILGQS